MSDSTTLLPFQSMSMSTAQLAAVADLARYSGHTGAAYQLRRWFAWCEVNELDPLAGIQRESHSHNCAKAQSERECRRRGCRTERDAARTSDEQSLRTGVRHDSGPRVKTTMTSGITC